MVASTVDQNLELRLKAEIRGDVFVDDVKRGVYATDASLYQVMPRCVVVPRDEADIVAAVAIAREFKLQSQPAEVEHRCQAKHMAPDHHRCF